MNEIENRFQLIRENVAKFEGKRESIENNLKRNEKELEKSNYFVVECEEAIKLLELVGEAGRASIKSEVEDLVTEALKTTFETEDYKFIVDFLKRRNQIECELLLETDGRESNPIESSGGGIADVISMALRFVILALSDNKGPSCMDEPAKQISAEFQRDYMAFLQLLSRSTGRQIIMSTHNDTYAYANRDNNVIRVELDDERNSIIKPEIIPDGN